MDHHELKEALERRLDKTDEKIDRNMDEVKALREDISQDRIKTAILENQMSGVVKIGLLLLSSVIGIAAYVVKQGM